MAGGRAGPLRAVAAGVHGHRRALLLRAAQRAAAVARDGGGDTGDMHCTAAEVPRPATRGRNGGGRRRHRFHGVTVCHCPGTAAVAAADPRDNPDRHRPFGGGTARRPADRARIRATGRWRSAATLAAGAAEEWRCAGDRHRRHGPAPRTGAAADAARLSGRMGPPARRLVQRPGRFRLRARASGTHRRNGSHWSAAYGAAVPGGDRAAHLGGGAGRGRRGVDHAADRHQHRHSATGPRRVPRFRPRTPAGGRGTAYRHRHGLDAGVRTTRLRGVRARQPALADQEAGGACRAFGRRRLHGADRHALADRTQFRHGVPVYRRGARRDDARSRCAASPWRRRC